MTARKAKKIETSISPVNMPAKQAAIYHALAKYAEKEAKATRDDMTAGQTERIELNISAMIEGCQPFTERVIVDLTVGGDSSRAGSGPSAKEVLAWFLTRLKVDQTGVNAILNELLADYQMNEGSLTIDNKFFTLAENYLKLAGASKTTTARGSVSTKVERVPTLALRG